MFHHDAEDGYGDPFHDYAQYAWADTAIGTMLAGFAEHLGLAPAPCEHPNTQPRSTQVDGRCLRHCLDCGKIFLADGTFVMEPSGFLNDSVLARLEFLKWRLAGVSMAGS